MLGVCWYVRRTETLAGRVSLNLRKRPRETSRDRGETRKRIAGSESRDEEEADPRLSVMPAVRNCALSKPN
jgi:hypothetical protein